MNSAQMTQKEMKYLIEKYKGENINKLLSTELLSHPLASSGPRQHLFSVHYTHRVMLKHPQPPRTFTGWEKIFGNYLNSFKKADKNYEIVAKIHRHSSFPDMIYLLVIRERGTNNYDVVQVSHYEKLSDQHGYLRPFTEMDKKDVGSFINTGELFYKASSLDAFGNYCYGKNTRVAFMTLHEVKEDSIVVSDEYADNTTFDLITKTEYAINKNDILTNIYGTIDDYKVLPFVGEYVNDKGILFATRKLDKKNIAADFTDMALLNIYYTDNKFAANGRVVDIDIKVNDVEYLQNSDPHRDQLLALYNDQLRYNQEIVNVLQPIINDQRNHVTDKLIRTLFNARNYIDPNIKYSCNTGNFEFIHMTVYTVDEQSLTIAMKMTNRCGGKAVIGKIWPKAYMPVDANGVRAEMICYSNGIIGRSNPDQLFDQLINYISDEILRRMKKCKTIDESIKLMVNYFKDMSDNKEWGNYIEEVYKRYTKKEKEEHLNELYNSRLGLMVYDPPADDTVGWDKLKFVANKYKITVSKIKMCKEYTVSEEIANNYDYAENIENVKKFTENYTFVATKDKSGNYTESEVGINDLIKPNKEYLKLSKTDKEKLGWLENYTFIEGEVGVNELLDSDKIIASDGLLSDYINQVQKLTGDWNEDELTEEQKKYGKDAFKMTESRVYRKDKNTIVREFTSMYPIIIGDIYEMLLKQMPNYAFSARALESISPLGLPNKSVKKDRRGKPYGDTANQLSEMDNVDLKNLVPSAKVNRLMAVHSTNPELRSEMAGMLMFADPTKAHDLPYNDDEIIDSVPAKMKDAYFSALGIEMCNVGDPDPYEFLDGVKYKTVADLMKKVGVVPESKEN